CICSRLRVALRFAQVPTGHTLPFGAGGGRRKVALLAQGCRIHRACRWIRIPCWRAAALQTSEEGCGREARRGVLRGAARRVSCAEGARNAGAACVRRKGGPCHSERSKGRDPLT